MQKQFSQHKYDTGKASKLEEYLAKDKTRCCQKFNMSDECICNHNTSSREMQFPQDPWSRRTCMHTHATKISSISSEEFWYLCLCTWISICHGPWLGEL